MRAAIGKSTRALTFFWSREFDGLPGASPSVTNNERFLFGLPGQKLIGINVRDEAPYAMKSVRQGEPASAPAFSQARDQHTMIACDENEAADGDPPLILRSRNFL